MIITIESPEYVDECLSMANKASWRREEESHASLCYRMERLACSHKALAERLAEYEAAYTPPDMFDGLCAIGGLVEGKTVGESVAMHFADLLTALAEANAQVFALLDEQTTTEAELDEYTSSGFALLKVRNAELEAERGALRTEASEARRGYVEAVDHRHTLRALLDEANAKLAASNAQQILTEGLLTYRREEASNLALRVERLQADLAQANTKLASVETERDEANVHCACIDAERGIALQRLAAAVTRETRLLEAVGDVLRRFGDEYPGRLDELRTLFDSYDADALAPAADATDTSEAPLPPASPEVTRDLLGLVDRDVSLATVRSWTQEQREQAADWAGAVHLRASDNDDVEVPPVPPHVAPLPPLLHDGIWPASRYDNALAAEEGKS